jgi:uncharacterized protein YndB with AHSA1/START domain
MTTAPAVPDRIQKQILLHAPRQRVWRALTDSREFGMWFGMRFTEPFRPGATVRGTIVPTTVDPDVARQQKQYEGITFEIVIDRIEPERLFSFRWHPGGTDPKADYSAEPMTLVTFELAEVKEGEGIMLTVTESGFDRIPLARRAAAFTGNERGWGMVLTLIEKYLAQKP